MGVGSALLEGARGGEGPPGSAPGEWALTATRWGPRPGVQPRDRPARLAGGLSEAWSLLPRDVHTRVCVCVCVCEIMSDSSRPRGLRPTRLPCPWVLQARTPQWVTMPSSSGSSRPRDRSCASRTAGGFFTVRAPAMPGRAQRSHSGRGPSDPASAPAARA